MERASWKRTLPELLSASNSEIVAMLEEDGLLPKWRSKMCPHCWKGTLTSTTRNNAPQYRCTANKCGKFVPPHHLHPLFNVCSGQSHKPQSASASYWCEDHFSASPFRCEPQDDGTAQPTPVHSSQACVSWKQWSGLVQRGKPKTLVLNRLNPPMTVKNAPGPGAIRKVDWLPLGVKHLKDRKVVLHTDSARSYKLKLSGVVHDSVVHCKKRMKIRKSEANINGSSQSMSH